MFTIYATDTNYSEIPTGTITMSFDEFVAQWDLEVVDETTVRAEWGNGEGYDTFTVEISESGGSPTHNATGLLITAARKPKPRKGSTGATTRY